MKDGNTNLVLGSELWVGKAITRDEQGIGDLRLVNGDCAEMGEIGNRSIVNGRQGLACDSVLDRAGIGGAL